MNDGRQFVRRFTRSLSVSKIGLLRRKKPITHWCRAIVVPPKLLGQAIIHVVDTI